MTRRLLALAVTAAAVASFAPQASAQDITSNIVPCVVEHNRLGFPYGGTDVDPVGTVLCIA